MPYTQSYRYRYGCQSEEVTRLQEQLLQAGYSVEVTGVFGEDTRQALVLFEQDLGLSESTSFTVDLTTLEYLFGGGVLTPPTPPEPSLGIPKGKGMFLRSWDHCESPGKLRSRIVEAGLSWVCVLRYCQYEDGDDLFNGNDENLDGFLTTLKNENCDLWLWGRPFPGREEEFISQMDNSVSHWGALGIILDCKDGADWVGHSAKKLMNLALGTGVTVGVSCDAGAWKNPNLPMEDWSVADFGVPQIYEAHGTWDAEFPQDAVNAWHQAGFRHVVPATSAFVPHMEDLLRRTPTPEQAVVFWDWYFTNRDARWDTIAKLSVHDS